MGFDPEFLDFVEDVLEALRRVMASQNLQVVDRKFEEKGRQEEVEDERPWLEHPIYDDDLVSHDSDFVNIFDLDDKSVIDDDGVLPSFDEAPIFDVYDDDESYIELLDEPGRSEVPLRRSEPQCVAVPTQPPKSGESRTLCYLPRFDHSRDCVEDRKPSFCFADLSQPLNESYGTSSLISNYVDPFLYKFNWDGQTKLTFSWSIGSGFVWRKVWLVWKVISGCLASYSINFDIQELRSILFKGGGYDAYTDRKRSIGRFYGLRVGSMAWLTTWDMILKAKNILKLECDASLLDAAQ